jgi:hypothetical protein
LAKRKTTQIADNATRGDTRLTCSRFKWSLMTARA